MTAIVFLACVLAGLAISRPVLGALRAFNDRADTLKTARRSRLIRERAAMVRAAAMVGG